MKKPKQKWTPSMQANLKWAKLGLKARRQSVIRWEREVKRWEAIKRKAKGVK